MLSFSIRERNQERFCDQLLGQFRQHIIFKLHGLPPFCFFAILVFPLTSTGEGHPSSCSTRDETMGDGELRFAFVILLKVKLIIWFLT